MGLLSMGPWWGSICAWESLNVEHSNITWIITDIETQSVDIETQPVDNTADSGRKVAQPQPKIEFPLGKEPVLCLVCGCRCWRLSSDSMVVCGNCKPLPTR